MIRQDQSKNLPKKLQLFIDGTANSAAQGSWADVTNVFRLILALHYEGNQIVSYMPGVGTRGDHLSILTARGMDEILREAYVNLASNYLPGDEIYIFGYSRGGAIALALADIIAKIGLLLADHLHELSVVWDVYLGRIGKLRLNDTKRRELKLRHLEGKTWLNGHAPRIKYLGLFDPVPGNSWDTSTRFSKVRLNSPLLPSSVLSSLSILSIDDDRNPSFSPVIMRGVSRDNQSLEQVWMPGVHADIGGNAASVFLSDISLLTMINDIQCKCPELIWDRKYVRRLEENIGVDVSVSIDNERSSLPKKFLFRNARQIGTNYNTAGVQTYEKVHSIFDYLHGKTFNIKGRRQVYSPLNVPPMLPRFVPPSDAIFKNGVDVALGRESE